jgi:hypothetical protein
MKLWNKETDKLRLLLRRQTVVLCFVFDITACVANQGLAQHELTKFLVDEPHVGVDLIINYPPQGELSKSSI